MRHVEDPHFIESTRLPSTEFSNAIVSSGGLAPSLEFPIRFKCTLPGHETVAMPYLTALIDLWRHDVLFASQLDEMWAIWKALVDLLDMAWDDDDAWECTPNQIPIRVLVTEYCNSARSRMPRSFKLDYYQMMTHGSKLSKNCFDYFKNKSDLEFENEDIRDRLKATEALATTPDLQDGKQVLEQWCSLRTSKLVGNVQALLIFDPKVKVSASRIHLETSGP